LNGDWTAAWAAIEGAVTAVWEGIKGVISGALLVVTSTLTMAWDAIKGDLERKWATIKAAVETVWTSITTSVSTAITSVKTTLSTAWTSIKTEVEGAWLSVRTSIEGAVQGALDFIAGLPATMLQFGKDLIQGFIDGIGRMAGSIKEAILNLLPPALRDLATQLGIKSPSTVMMWYGKQLMAGLAKGVESYASLPRRELSGVLADVASMGSRGGSSANTSVAGGAYGAGVGMTATPRDEMYVVSITLDGEEIARKLLSRVTGLVHDDMGRYAPA
jgi:phage-related protein